VDELKYNPYQSKGKKNMFLDRVSFCVEVNLINSYVLILQMWGLVLKNIL